MRFLLIDNELDLLLKLKRRMEAVHSSLEIIVKWDLSSRNCLEYVDLVFVGFQKANRTALELIPIIRSSVSISIIVAAAFENEYDIVLAYNYGADFCLQKPLEINVLEACLSAQLRRLRKEKTIDNESPPEVIDIGDLVINPQNRVVMVSGRTIQLTSKEFDLLFYMASNPNRILTQTQIYERVWKSEELYNSNLTSRIARLRKKIEPDPSNPRYIRTYRGVGYLFMSN